jgi:hypothetical protein
MGEWKKWMGVKGQFEEITMSEHGFILKNILGTESPVLRNNDFDSDEHVIEYIKNYDSTHYLIITKDPLRDMKIRQAQTGQPVWCRPILSPRNEPGIETCFPNWNLRDVEFSFKPFVENN